MFNTKSPAVAAWFWRHFDREAEFFHLTREARILLNGVEIGYPLENHLYQLPAETSAKAVAALLGGEATVLSSPGQGTTVEARLPFRDPRVPA